MATNDKPPFGNDDVDNPLPERMLEMLAYNKEDSFVKPSDVVNFLMHQEPIEDAELEEAIEQHKVRKD